ncbi:MAG: hypothetical protein QM534_17450 [Sediminibacterium sp.]|nr:hypothetical protein [Sediminibacterium sp.]
MKPTIYCRQVFIEQDNISFLAGVTFIYVYVTILLTCIMRQKNNTNSMYKTPIVRRILDK